MQISSTACQEREKESSVFDGSFFLINLMFIALTIDIILLVVWYIRRRNDRIRTPMIYTDTDEGFDEWAQSLPGKPANLFLCSSTLPSSYEPFAITAPVKDQGMCGLCGMFALVGVLADRLSRQQNRRVSLSEFYLARCLQSCNPPGTHVCQGTTLYRIASFLTATNTTTCAVPSGIPEETCLPLLYFHNRISTQGPLIEESAFAFAIISLIMMFAVLLAGLSLDTRRTGYIHIYARNQRPPRMPLNIVIMYFMGVLILLMILIYLIIILMVEPSIRRYYKMPIIMTYGLFAIVLIIIVVFRTIRLSFMKKIVFSFFPVIMSLVLCTLIFTQKMPSIDDWNKEQMRQIDDGCPKTCNDGSTPNLYTVNEFYRLERTTQTDAEWMATIKCYILSQGSLLCDVPVPNTYVDEITMMSATPFDPKLIPQNHFPAGNHSMVLIGWDDEMGAWIVRNSWSTHYPNKGYIYWKYGTGIETNRLIGCTV